MIFNKEVEALVLIIILSTIHFIFSKIVLRPKKENFRPRPSRNRTNRKTPIVFINEDLCFLSIIFIFLLLYDIFYYLIIKNEVPSDLKEIAPFFPYVLILFFVNYSICLYLNKKFSLLKWRKKRAPTKRQRKIAKREIIITGIFSFVVSLISLGATIFYASRVVFRISNI